MIYKIFEYVMVLKFILIFSAVSFLAGMGYENRDNNSIRQFETTIQDDMEHGRDFVIFGKYKVYASKENINVRYYRVKHHAIHKTRR